jgi:GH25 family lysozyme M1 (1,4-beta-N-acetylmuramidase)
MSDFKIKFRHRNKPEIHRLISSLRKFLIFISIGIAILVLVHALELAGIEVTHLIDKEVTPVDSTQQTKPYAVPQNDTSVSYHAGHSYARTNDMDTMRLGKEKQLIKQMYKQDSTDIAGYYGIDVSNWQGHIDWDQVVKDTLPERLSFFIVKATQGVTIKDQYFDQNWAALEKNNVIKGAYHFYSYRDDPTEQANFFIQTVKLSTGDITPIIDVELACTNCNEVGIDKKTLIDGLQNFVDVIEKEYGISPIIYTYSNFYETYLKGHFEKYSFWMAKYASQPPSSLQFLQNQSPESQLPLTRMWQFTGSDHVDGIVGKVSMSFVPAFQVDSLLIK